MGRFMETEAKDNSRLFAETSHGDFVSCETKIHQKSLSLAMLDSEQRPRAKGWGAGGRWGWLAVYNLGSGVLPGDCCCQPEPCGTA